MQEAYINIGSIAGLVVAFILAIAQVVLQALIRNNDYMKGEAATNWPPPDASKAGQPYEPEALYGSPAHYQWDSSNSLLISASITIALAFAAVLNSASKYNNDMSTRTWNRLYHIVLAAALTSNLVALIVATVQKYRSSTWHYTEEYSLGKYSHEAWACQMQYIFEKSDGEEFGHVCRLATASRWLTIPIALILCVVAVLVVMRSRQEARDSTGKQFFLGLTDMPPSLPPKDAPRVRIRPSR